MEVGDRKIIEELEKDLMLWAQRYSDARLKFSKAKTQAGIILASKDYIKDSSAFENKMIQLLATEDNPVYVSIWGDYIHEYNKYKSAMLMWETVMAKINNYKFIHRLIT